MLDVMIDAVLLNGTVGAGKSTTASALSHRLSVDGVVHAVIDTDWIRLLWPAPSGDPFQQAIATVNLRDLARNYRAAGAVRLIVAGVVEDADGLTDLRGALAPSRVLACRLTATAAAVDARLRARHAGDDEARDWHVDRAPRLAATLASAGLDDAVIDTTGATTTQTAARVAAAAGW